MTKIILLVINFSVIVLLIASLIITIQAGIISKNKLVIENNLLLKDNQKKQNGIKARDEIVKKLETEVNFRQYEKCKLLIKQYKNLIELEKEK